MTSRARAWSCRWAGIAAAAVLAGCGGAPPGPAPVPPTDVAAIDTPPPEYPIDLACESVGGRVELMVVVGTDGRLTLQSIQRSSGHAALDEAAAKAIGRWKFEPATANGRPVAKRMLVPVTFTPPPIPPDRCHALQEQRDAAG